jgi:alkylation response protein AidB-like acyl-CoA dehydrogenase
MDISLSGEQESLRQSARQLMSSMEEWERIPDDFDGSGSQPWWQRVTATGWLGIGVAEAAGGPGGSLLDLGIVFRELGRVAAPSRFRSAVTGRLVYEALARDDQREAALADLADQSLTATVAFAEPGVSRDPRCLTTTARRRPDGWVLSGRKSFVPDAGVSDLVIITARGDGATDGAVSFFAVPTKTPGLTLHPQRVFGGDPYFEITLEDAKVAAEDLLGQPADPGQHHRYRSALDGVCALVALEAIGGTEAILDQTVEYVKNRTQFGLPIGGFQAVQHHLADVTIGLTGGRLAAWKAATNYPDRRAAAIAKAVACRNFKEATLTCHQVLGGIGITEEFFLLKYSARAKLLEQIGDGWESHLETVAVSLGL